MPDQHRYIVFSDKPRTGTISEVARLLTEHLFKGIRQQSINAWRRDRTLYQLSWTSPDGTRQQSAPINYLKIAEFIREKGYFDREQFNLPRIECFWLDFSLDYKINWHVHDHTAPDGMTVQDATGQQQYGPNYPIVPRLRREGHSFTTLQPQLLTRIYRLRHRLVETSHLALDDDWFFDLRTLINDTVSIVEITLNQLYNKAQYDPLPHWQFNRQALGSKQGRRFADKLGWVYQIAGRHLNAEMYLPGVNTLRELRNHLMHFDPPSLVIPIEEAVIWLNQVIDVGYLLVKIRQAIGVEVSLQLLNFLLQKEAIFNPEPHFANRLPFAAGQGDYASSTW